VATQIGPRAEAWGGWGLPRRVPLAEAAQHVGVTQKRSRGRQRPLPRCPARVRFNSQGATPRTDFSPSKR